VLVLSRATGQNVRAADGRVIGKLRDLTARLGVEHPVVYRLVIGSRRGLTCLVPWTAVPTFEPSEVQLRDVGPLDPFLIGRGENRRTADVDGRHFQRTPKHWRISPTRRTDEPEQIVDLGALADAAATRATRRTGRHFRVEAEHTVVRGRRQGLERAVGNLLENAAKFDDGNTPIEVHIRGGRITVLDRGPGIDAADCGHVFDRFYRADGARSLPGSGLGLSIVHDVAQAHGGTVFAGTRPGGGAAVGFTVGPDRLLPRSQPGHADASPERPTLEET
jgi:two-component system, OmpR family, sensor histidine kinase MprB